jgi:uncharacterized protein with FMN-binding domain
MKASRELRAVLAALVLLAAASLLVSCNVDKAALARQVGLQNVELKNIPNGVYEAAYTIQPPAGVMSANTHVRVRVTVAGGRWQRIELLEPPGLGSNKTCQALTARLVEAQELSVDAISGATITSMAVLKAVQSAIARTGK